MTIENGLLTLETQAGGRPRRQPPPRHAKRSVEVPPPPTAVQQPSPQTEPVPAEVLDLRPEAEAAPPRTEPDPLRPTQVHLDSSSQDFLRRCGAAGLLQGSRDVTMSGVIRFALGQLAASSSPEDVARAMLAGDSALRRPGRRRL